MKGDVCRLLLEVRNDGDLAHHCCHNECGEEELSRDKRDQCCKGTNHGEGKEDGDLVPLGRRDIGGDRKSDERSHGQRRAVGKLPREGSYWPEPSLRNC